MPRFDAAPMPPKKPRGTEMTSAQGQETMRKMQARLIQGAAGTPSMSDGTIASKNAVTVTTGVYQRAKRVMKFSMRVFFSLALSTSCRMRATVESSYAFVVFTRSAVSPFTQPLITASPGLTSRGTGSPVSAAVSRKELPSRTMPSSGTFSPGRIRMTEPTSTSSGSSCSISPSRSTFAYSGAMLIIAVIDARDFPTASDSKSSPTW